MGLAALTGDEHAIPCRPAATLPPGTQAAVMPLQDGAVLVTVLAEDNLTLRRLLTTGLTALEQR